MKKTFLIKFPKIIIALLLVSATHIAMGSFTGTTEDKTKNIYSLKNFNKNLLKSHSIFSLTAGFQYTGSQLISLRKDSNGDVNVNSMMRFEKGNTTYIYPYKHKVTVPKFKTPSAPSFR